MDFVIDFFIMLTEPQDQFILPCVQYVWRGIKTVATAVIGGDVVGSAISVSPPVELPGVNKSQVYLGRGHCYKMLIN
jgi:hypothetical protein